MSAPSSPQLGRRSSTVWLLVFAAVVSLFFLAQQFGRDTYLFAHVLTARRVAPFGELSKLVPQLLGSLYAARCAGRYEKKSAARLPWLLLSASFGAWFAGQIVLATYEVALQETPPAPSAADLFFTVGYALLIVALVRFASAYRASGFAVGSLREHAAIALGACAVFAAIGSWLLIPRALTPSPLAGRIVDVGYPLLDLATLVPALVILRITIRFRGGEVWRVWGALLTGILFLMCADLVFSDASAAYLEQVAPITDLLSALGYAFCGYGARLQYEMVRG
jgi:hypothetical protein